MVDERLNGMMGLSLSMPTSLIYPYSSALENFPIQVGVGGGGKRKKSWTRAVFSNLQRKGLEKRFQIQKYITKPDRRQLAASLGLTDAQVGTANL